MTDRLQQIWKGFEQRTSRNLTGTGVDNIPRPVIEEMERHRSLMEDAHKAAAQPMPEGVEEPAAAAFDALRARLTSFDSKGRPVKDGGRRREAEPDVNPSATYRPTEKLLADLKATENLTARREPDYLSHAMKMRDETNGRRKRKKFLGLF